MKTEPQDNNASKTNKQPAKTQTYPRNHAVWLDLQ